MNAIMGMNEMIYRAAQEKDFDKISYFMEFYMKFNKKARFYLFIL